MWGRRECMERQLSKNCSRVSGLTGPRRDSMPGKCPAKTPGCRVDQNGSDASSRPRRSIKHGCGWDNVRVVRSIRCGRPIAVARPVVECMTGSPAAHRPMRRLTTNSVRLRITWRWSNALCASALRGLMAMRMPCAIAIHSSSSSFSGFWASMMMAIAMVTELPSTQKKGMYLLTYGQL
ncbi:hypothetical protein BC827DRAFT_1207979 [Russula dissimulans]|nr:hypothetical protein BC827DRAFT_1207979 [Russula dissimulans]